jgi:hypothetical protein
MLRLVLLVLYLIASPFTAPQASLQGFDLTANLDPNGSTSTGDLHGNLDPNG